MYLEILLFNLLLFLLPVQLSKFYFNESILLNGARVDYLAVSVYLTDFLILAILFLWLIRSKFKPSCFKKTFLLLILLLINPFFSLNKTYAFIKALKILEFTSLGYYVFKNNLSLKRIGLPLVLGSITPCLLAILQFIKQRSVGGIFWILGERTFTTNTPNIAKAVIDGRLILRPYATFSHPNVLAAYLSLVLLISYYLFLRTKKSIYKFLPFVIFPVLLLTFSRTAIVVTLISVFIIFYSNFKKERFLIKQGLFILAALILFLPFLFNRFSGLLNNYDDSLFLRKELFKSSIDMILINPFVGIGFNNFLYELPNHSSYLKQNGILQPVHNVFLLVLIEAGIIGLIFLLLLLYFVLKKIRLKPKKQNLIYYLILFEVIFFLTQDHFFYTLQQGEILFTILLGAIISKDE